MNPILRIVTIIVFAFVIIWAIGTPFNKALSKYDHKDYVRLSEIYESKTDYNMLFIGSSRTRRSVYPMIIDSICAVRSYNAGTEGGSMPDFKLTLQGYLVNHPAPGFLVLTLDLPSFSNTNKLQNYPQYYAFLNNQAVNRTFAETSDEIYLIRLFPFLSITDQDDYTKERVIQTLRGKENAEIDTTSIDYRGFLSNGDGYIKKPELEKVIKRMSITHQSVNDLDEMMALCRAKHIQVIFTYAPEFNFNLQRTRTNKDSVFGLIYRTAHKYDIPVLRDDSLDICRYPEYFANNGHLNKPGAIAYSAILAKEIKKIMAKDKAERK
jgi:hypothetical protein